MQELTIKLGGDYENYIKNHSFCSGDSSGNK